MTEIVSPVLREVVEAHVQDRLQKIQKLVEERLEQRMMKATFELVMEVTREVARDESRNMIVRILRHRYGADAEPIVPRLDAIHDKARLDELGELAYSCHDLDEFRAHLPA